MAGVQGPIVKMGSSGVQGQVLYGLPTRRFHLAALMAFGREDYERQGAQVLSSGSEFRCSSDSIIKAVIMMARDNSHRFKNILDVGCGADPTYAREIAAMDKQVHGVDYTFNFLRLAQPGSGNMRLAQAD